MPSVLFVCTANVCRSPMAAAVFQRFLQKRPDAGEWRVASAGTWALDGEAAASKAQEVMRRRGLDISHHRSQSVSPELLRRFSLILVMERGHKEALRVEFPALAGRIFLLNEMIGLRFDIPDPVGGSLADFDDTAAEFERIFEHGFPRIAELASRLQDTGGLVLPPES